MQFGSIAASQELLSRNKADEKRKQRQRICTMHITNLPQLFTKTVLSGASMSTGSSQLQPRKIFSHWVSTMMLSINKKDLKQKGLGNKLNAAQPVETEDIEKMWSSGVIGLQNPRSLLHLVWRNNVTHLWMSGFKEEHDCQLSDFTVTARAVHWIQRATNEEPSGRRTDCDKTGKKVQQQDLEDAWRIARPVQSIYRVRWPSFEGWQRSWKFLPESSWQPKIQCLIQDGSNW